VIEHTQFKRKATLSLIDTNGVYTQYNTRWVRFEERHLPANLQPPDCCYSPVGKSERRVHLSAAAAVAVVTRSMTIPHRPAHQILCW